MKPQNNGRTRGDIPFQIGFAADGVGTLANFIYPFGMTKDGTSLYITDITRCNIIKNVIMTGLVVTLAGSAEEGSTDRIGVEASTIQSFLKTLLNIVQIL